MFSCSLFLATESAAVFDIANRLNIIQEENYQAGRAILIRIVSMLTKMAQRTELPDKDTLFQLALSFS